MIWIPFLLALIVAAASLIVGIKAGLIIGKSMAETNVINYVINNPGKSTIALLDELYSKKKDLYHPSWDAFKKPNLRK